MGKLCQLAARLRRLHPVTWCAMALVTVVMVIIVVPGEQVYQCSDQSWTSLEYCAVLTSLGYADHFRSAELPSVKVFVHGYPWPCFLRGVQGRYPHEPNPEQARVFSKPLIKFSNDYSAGAGTMNDFVSWSHYDSWPLAGDHVRVHYWHLFGTLAVFVSVVAVAGGSVEWWVRSRGGLFRFRLLDLLLLTAVICTGLTWYQHHASTKQAEREVEEYFYGGNRNPIVPVPYYGTARYCGPSWLARLVGHVDLLPLFHHINSCSLKDSPESWREDLNQIKRLRYLRHLALPSHMPIEGLDQLKQLPRLRSISVWDNKHSYFSLLKEDLGIAQLIAPNFGSLERLEVEEIEITGCNVLAEDIERIARFPNLRVLKLLDVSASLDEIDAIRTAYPKVSITAQWYKVPNEISPFRNRPPAGHAQQILDIRDLRERGRLYDYLKHPYESAEYNLPELSL